MNFHHKELIKDNRLLSLDACTILVKSQYLWICTMCHHVLHSAVLPWDRSGYESIALTDDIFGWMIALDDISNRGTQEAV